ncbi:ABC-type Fe3+ transport system protein [Cupriavidus sp. U2]|uniref:c-type cytochrome n=1 Tax=Cupriavidus sp. U2 TaxID=2920269 RepID=UPI00129D36AC|nr:cytochrome c [Cupriavidus sp. U2]KAI3593172.1 ABC-type Fe3+ transport system protein [Cupriavidus sp. U2]
MTSVLLRCLWLLCASCTLALVTGCERARQDMYDQPKYKPYARSNRFGDGTSARPLPDNTVPAPGGPFAATSSGRSHDEAASASRPPLTLQQLQRGQSRYEIYCMPCHSPTGDGDGMVVRRGFPRPPSFHTDALRAAPDTLLYDVITHGSGQMAAYAAQLPPPDRWAVVGYLRALQLGQHAPAARLTADDLRQLDANAPGEGQP